MAGKHAYGLYWMDAIGYIDMILWLWYYQTIIETQNNRHADFDTEIIIFKRYIWYDDSEKKIYFTIQMAK